MGCSHNYVFTQGHFYCTKCGKRSYGKSYKRKQGKKIAAGVILVIMIGVVVLVFSNGVLEFNQENLEKSVERISSEIPQIEELQTKIQDTSDEIIKRFEEEQIRVEEEQKISDEKYLQDITQKVHKLINNERTSRGLSSLTWNSHIAQASLNHSTDMLTQEYFEHESPEGHDFSWRYSKVGFDCMIPTSGREYSLGGENIMYLDGYYGVDTVATETVNGWMNSPGHRANILTPYFQSEGIGVAISYNEVYVTQNFC
ncbi:MAG: CAP domain-containing protein [Thaumarchaeota archaeon]|nr:CAP domain-containing protein [Nitrososphaerota archaeon]